MPDFDIGTQIPSGVILMWKGTIATIPQGWVLCNGANGTPDLRNRFVVCANADELGVAKSTIQGAAAQTGGSLLHTHSGTTDGHFHGFSGSLDAGTSIITAGTGSAEPTLGGATESVSDTFTTGNPIEEPCPPFYALAYIMKL